MSGLDFHAHVAARGDVLGVGVGAEPEEWERRLGSDFVDDRDRALLRRDYGLVELSFQQQRDGSWPCFGVSVPIHRLRWDPESAVPPALRSAYGDFGPSVRLGDLTAAVAALGGTVEPDDDGTDGAEGGGTTSDFRRYRVRESGVRLFVRAAPDLPPALSPVTQLSVSPAWWGAVTG
ncbi:hypothetical protein [Streptomyces roseoviridis]|uniref:Uncharacterized protein n=1 Tax=Streptomyces roseoviridis TaxID=67361 RepID=A0ABV5QRK0_9ACTN